MVDELDSIQSKRQEIWWKLYAKLNLNPGRALGGGRARVLMAIRPTISVDEMLRTPAIKRAVEDVGVGGNDMFTVPDGERWKLVGYYAAVSTGDRDVSQLFIKNIESPVINVAMDLFAAAAIRQHVFPVSFWLLPGWRISLLGEGGTTDGDWTLAIYVEVEEVSTD